MCKRRAAYFLIIVSGMMLFAGGVLAQSPNPPPEIDLSADSYDYGLVKVGYAEDWVLRVANRGLGRLQVYDIASDNPSFYVSDPDTFPQGVDYSGGRRPDSLLVTVTFSPHASGSISGRLSVLSNDTDEETLFVDLEGEGIAPEINLFETSHDFNGVVVGSSLDWTLVINNTGPADLIVSGVSSSDPSFLVLSPVTFPQSIVSGGKINAVIRFAPTAGGVKIGNIIVQSDDPDESTLYVSVMGNGLAADIDVSSMMHDFGELMVGATATWNLEILNEGSLDLILSHAVASPADFRIVSPSLPQTIDPGTVLPVAISFEPSKVGEIPGTLTLRSNDPDESEVIITLSGRGIPQSPDVELSETSHTFDDVLVGSSSTWDFILYNRGLNVLQVNSVIPDQAGFSVLAPIFPQSILPGDSISVTVAFTPASAGERTCLLTVRSNDPDEATLTISLFARGIAPQIGLSATSHQFNNVLVGSSSVWPVRISNGGTADLVVESIISSHPNFVVADPAFPRTVPPGQSVTQAVVFTPSSLGLIAGNLTMNSNDPNQPVILISVTGIGVKPDIYLSADQHDFGQVYVGNSSPWILKIRNFGTAALTVTGVLSNRAVFAVAEPLFPQTINPGASLDVRVMFSPAVAGEVTGNLTVVSNDPEQETLIVSVRGVGAPPPAPRILVADDSHDFEGVDVSAASEWRIYLYNKGDLDLVISAAESDNPDFRVIHPPYFPRTVVPLAYTDVIVEFVPSQAGTETGQITIVSNDPAQPLVSLNVVGRGLAPKIDISSLAHDFGHVLLLNPKPWVMQITNQGSKPLHIASLTSDQEEFAVASPAFPQTIEAGASLEVTVTFTPVSEGTRTASLTIVSDDPFQDHMLVPLSGSGVATEIHVSGTSNHYGPIRVGDTETWTVIITNIGREDLIIDRISSTHPDFAVLSPIFPQRLTTYCGLEMVIGFTPSSEGYREASLTVYSNDSFQPCSPLMVDGTGIAPDMALSATGHDFGDVLLGQSRQWALVLSNTGTVALEVNSASSDLGDFAVMSPAFPLTVDPGQEVDMVVRFNPVVLGERAGHLVFHSDDYDEGSATVALSGRGVSPEIELSEYSHDFGLVWAGECALWSFVITNHGNYDLVVSDMAGCGSDFTVVEPAVFPQRIHPRCDLQVTVQFCAGSVGAEECRLLIETNHPVLDDVEVWLSGEGVLPEIAASTVFYNFGGLPVGETSQWNLTIFNRGKAPLSIEGISLTNDIDFSIPDYPYPFVIGPQESMDLPILFQPGSTTHKESDLVILSNDPDQPVLTVALKGKGLVRDILVSQEALDFGSVSVGQSAEQILTVSNVGQLFLDVTEISSNNPDFLVTAPSLPCTLSNGASLEVAITFVPSSGGLIAGSIQIRSTDPDEGIINIGVKGFGLSGGVLFSAYEYAFPDVVVGQCADWLVTLTNTGNDNLEVRSVGVDHPDFSVETLSVPSVLAPGEQQDMIVAFCPSVPGAADGHLEVCVNGSIDECYVLPLAANGTAPDISFSVFRHDYGSVYVGGTSNWALFVLNTGTADLTVNDVLSSGTEFVVVSPTFPRTLAPGASIGIVTAFTPSMAGSFSANLNVVSNDPDEGSALISLEGEGVLPGFHLSDTYYDFGTIIAGQSQSWDFSISNTGGARLTIFEIQSDQPEFSLQHPALPLVLGPDEEVNVSVLFAPLTSGGKTGTIRIITDDPQVPEVTIGLTGRAVVTDIELSDNEHDFGDVLIGGWSEWTLVVTNGGNVAMTILDMVSDRPEFAVMSEGFPLTIAPQEQAGILVRFFPPQRSLFEGMLTLTIADFAEAALTVHVTGQGVQQDIEISSLAHDFGNVAVGDSGIWQGTITNAGTAVLTIHNLAMDHGDFLLTEIILPVMILPGESFPVNVTFRPSSPVPANARLTIASDDPDEETISVALSGRGVDADVYTSDSFHDFGDVAIGSSLGWTFTIVNLGKVELHVNGVLSSCQSLSVTSPDFPVTIRQGNELPVTVAFAPVTEEALLCTLQIVSDDPDEGSLEIVVTGRGMGSRISVAVRGIDFGDVRIGHSVERSLIISNLGSLGLTVHSLIADLADYEILAPSLPCAIGGLDSVQAVIRFTPQSAGLAEGMLSIGSTDPAQPQLGVSLHGSGIVPDIELSSLYHGYGGVHVGTTSNWALLVRNTGSDELVVSSVLSSSPDYTIVSPVFPQNLAPGTSIGIVVRFAPQDVGLREGTMTVNSDDPDEGELVVALNGHGILPDIEVSAMIHDFGNVVAGDTASWTMTISNAGAADLVVSSFSSDQADFFALMPQFPLTLAPGERRDVTIGFCPLSGQQINGHLSIASNDPDDPMVVVNVTGAGIASDIYLAADFHDFGQVLLGDTAVWILPVYNIGKAPLTVWRADLQVCDVRLVSPGWPLTINPGQSVDLAFTYVPSVLGSAECTVTLASNDVFEPRTDISLKGEGVPAPLLQAGDGHGDPGSSGNGVFINLNTPVSIASVEFNLTYNSQLLTITDAQLADFGRHMDIFNVAFPHPDQIVILIQDLDGGLLAPGSGPIVELTMRVHPEAPLGHLPLNLIGVILSQADGKAVPVTTDNGVFTVTVPDISVPVQAHDFGRVPLHHPQDWPCPVANAGTEEIIISQVITGHGDYYPVEPSFPCTVAVAETVTVLFRFMPSAFGPLSANALFQSNDPDEGDVNVSLYGFGIDPDVCMGEVSHDFGAVPVGSSVVWNAPLINLGRGELIIDTLYTLGDIFSVKGMAFPLVVMERETVFTAVPFAPSGVASFLDTLVVMSNDPFEERFVLPLRGRGIAPDIEMSFLHHDFGQVEIGQAADWELVISNVGEVDLTVDSLRIGPEAYSYVDPGFPRIIPFGGSLSLVISLAPVALGRVDGDLVVYSGDPDEGSVTVVLTGLGVGPDISVTSPSHIFDRVKLGQSQAWEFSISNQGTRKLVIESVVSDTPDFIVVLPDFPQMILPNEAVVVQVSFQPSVVGMIHGKLTVASNDPEEPMVYVTLMGHGAVPEIELSAQELAFGDVGLGAAAERTLIVRNSGDAELVLASLSSSHESFSIGGLSLPVVIAKRDSLEVTVLFTPSILGQAQGVLSLVSDDADESMLEVALSGRGIAPAALTLGNGHGAPGSPDNAVFVYLDNVVPVATLRFLINFDPNLLSVVDVHGTERITHMDSFEWDIPHPGEAVILVSDFGGEAIAAGSGAILRIGFDVDPEADLGTAPLTFTGVALYNVDEEEILTETTNGFFTIGTTYMYHFGDVPVGGQSTISIDYTWPSDEGDEVVVEGIGCDNPDFTVEMAQATPVHTPASPDKLKMHITFRPSRLGEEWGLISLRVSGPNAKTVLLPIVGKGISVSQPSWMFELTCTSSDVSIPDSMRTRVLTIGLDVEATDSFDMGLDAALPPIAPGSKFEAYFPALPEYVGRLSTDIRSSLMTGAEWTIETMGSGGTIIWNPASLPEGEFELTGALAEPLNMRYVSQTSFVRNATVSIRYTNTQSSVQMSALSVECNGDWARVCWEMSNEENIVGYNLYRVDRADLGPTSRDQVNMSLITGTRSFFYVDREVTPGVIYYYWVEAVGYDGAGILLGSVSTRVAVPRDCALSQNYPNPFNPETSIGYTVNIGDDISLVVYNALGQCVRTLVQAYQSPGAYTVTWDGRSDAGDMVPSGIYLYRLVAGRSTETRKMVLMK